jgi:hypothetical protein
LIAERVGAVVSAVRTFRLRLAAVLTWYFNCELPFKTPGANEVSRVKASVVRVLYEVPADGTRLISPAACAGVPANAVVARATIAPNARLLRVTMVDMLSLSFLGLLQFQDESAVLSTCYRPPSRQINMAYV